MAGEIGNPLGYVPVFDGGDPGIVTGNTEAVVSGGAPVYASGAAGAVGSHTESFAWNDIHFLTGASGNLFNGVAIATAGSNTPVSVATRGVIIGKAAGTITGGTGVKVNAGGFVSAGSAKDANVCNAWGADIVGRALSAAGSDSYALIQLK